MSEEIFNEISERLSTSGISVLSMPDGTISVSLPDSDTELGRCSDNGDGTVSYTLNCGDGSTDTGTGTPEEFVEHTCSTLDTWFDFVLYDSEAVEPGISKEYRTAIGESREGKMRSALLEMGLNVDQVDAVIGIRNAIYESSMVTVNINGKTVSGSSVPNIISRKENKPFLTRQWALKELGLSPNDRSMSTQDMIKKIGKAPSQDDLANFVKSFLFTMETERVMTDDDVLASAKQSFGGMTKVDSSHAERAAAGASSSEETFNTDSAPVSGESDDYDEEIHATGAKDSDGLVIDDKHTSQYAENVINKGDIAGSGFSIEGKGDIIDEEGNVVDTDGEDEEVVVDGTDADEPKEHSIADMWKGDLTTLADDVGDSMYNYSMPSESIQSMQNKVADASDKIVNEIATGLDDVNAFINKKNQSIEDPAKKLKPIDPALSQTLGRLSAELFGRDRSDGKIGGIIGKILDGELNVLREVEAGKTLLNTGLTPAQQKDFSFAINSGVFKSSIKSLQNVFRKLVNDMCKDIADAYDEARGVELGDIENGSVGGNISLVAPDFVTFIRALLSDDRVPFAGYPWDFITKLCTNLPAVLGNGTGSATTSKSNVPGARANMARVVQKAKDKSLA